MMSKKLILLLLISACVLKVYAQTTFNSFSDLTTNGAYFDCYLFQNDLNIVLPKYPISTKVSFEGTKDAYVDNLPQTMKKLLPKVFQCDYNNVHIVRNTDDEKLFLIIEALQIEMEKVGKGPEVYTQSYGGGNSAYTQITRSIEANYYSFKVNIKYTAKYKGKTIGSENVSTTVRKSSKAWTVPQAKAEYKFQVSQSAFNLKSNFNKLFKNNLGISCSLNNSNNNKLNPDLDGVNAVVIGKSSYSKKWFEYLSGKGVKTDNISAQYTIKFFFYKNNGKNYVTYNIYDNTTKYSIKHSTLISDKKFSIYDFSKLYLDIFK